MPLDPTFIGRRPVVTRRTRMALLLTSAGLGLMFAQPAMAQCVPQGGGDTVVCSGENTATINVVNAGPVTVTTQPGFSVDAAAGDALTIVGNGPVTYTDANASTLNAGNGRGLAIIGGTGGTGKVTVRTAGAISGGLRGLQVNSTGSGGMDIIASGPVTAGSHFGIALLNEALVNDPLIANDIRLLAGDVSGQLGIVAENRGGSGSIVLTSTGTVTGTDVNGFAVSGFISVAGVGRDMIIEMNDVVGAGGGIGTTNLGVGQTSITVNGDLTAANLAGITATNRTGATDLTVVANGAVTAGGTGITATNQGTGDTSVTAKGQVTAGTVSFNNGISASNTASGGDMSVTAAGVDGSASGIVVFSAGSGSTTVTATGLVRAREGDGISVTRRPGGTGTTINVAAVEGTDTGIFANIAGDGDVVLTATGLVSGAALDGIRVNKTGGSGDVMVSVVDVSGSEFGLQAVNSGTGDTRITATGAVTAGDDGFGLTVSTGANAGDTVVNVVDVSGGRTGLLAFNGGSGTMEINATGDIVSSVGDGLFALTNLGAGDLTINAVNVAGDGRFGLVASYSGVGETRVTATGSVRGAETGLLLFTNTTAQGVFADVRNATGGDFGVSAETRGLGGLELITRGTVEGGIAGITVIAVNGESFTIDNSGVVRNSSGLSSDLAIRSTGGAGTITNTGTLFGVVSLGAPGPVDDDDDDDDDGGDGGGSGDDDDDDEEALGMPSFAAAPLAAPGDGHSLINAGDWNSIGGVSEFLGAADSLFNQATGRLIGGVSAGTAETTLYSGLEILTNAGTITLRDGGVGDVIHTTGDASFTSGSVLAVDAGGAGSDRFIADGATVIAAGAQLVVNTPQAPVLGTRYTVLQSAGGVTGTFNFADQMTSAFLGFRDGYTASTVFVELAKVRPFIAAGETDNQRNVAGALDSLPNSNPLAAAVLVLPTDASARLAFDALSGEIHPGLRTVMIEDSRLPRDAVLARLDERDERSVWGRAIGNWGESDGGDGVAPLDRDTRGVIFGADMPVGDTVMVGLAGSYLETDVDLPARASTANLKTAQVVGYGGVRFGQFGVKAGMGYGSAEVETARGVAFPGIAQTLAAGYDGTLIQAFVEAGYRVPLGEGRIEPFVQLISMRAKTDSFGETGGTAALIAEGESDTATFSTLGLRFATSPDSAFSVRGLVGWQHGYGSQTPETSFRFAAGDSFTTVGAGRSKDAAVASIDARFRLAAGVTLGVSYDGAFGSEGTDQSVAAAFRIAF